MIQNILYVINNESNNEQFIDSLRYYELVSKKRNLNEKIIFKKFFNLIEENTNAKN